MNQAVSRKKNLEPFVFVLIFFGLFGYMAFEMGLNNMMKTAMNTAHDLLKETVLFLMGVMVLAGAFGKLLTEFGVVGILEKLLAPLMRPLFGLPGVASLAGLMTFLSDNPAIISLSHDKGFRKYFKPYQLISLTNFGTAFGMGLIVIMFMATLKIISPDGQEIQLAVPALLGLVGAILGAVVSTRIMQRLIRDDFTPACLEKFLKDMEEENKQEEVEHKSTFLRFMDAILDGGKSGVQMGLEVIPGVIIICTVVMMITFGDADPSTEVVKYTGAAYEGVPLLKLLGSHLSGIFQFLFGFDSPELVAFPITSLGAVGAAMSLVPRFMDQGIITGNEIAVFTAMGMCWSGYLSTHTAMLDTLGYRKLTPKALTSHTIGGLVAGVAAHILYTIFF